MPEMPHISLSCKQDSIFLFIYILKGYIYKYSCKDVFLNCMSFMNTTVQALFTPHFVLYMIFFDSPICMLAENITQTLLTLQTM